MTDYRDLFRTGTGYPGRSLYASFLASCRKIQRLEKTATGNWKKMASHSGWRPSTNNPVSAIS